MLYQHLPELLADLGMGLLWENVKVFNLNDETNGPCYVNFLTNAQAIAPSNIHKALELAMQHQDEGYTGILCVSVTTKESNHKAWLEQAENYPGAVITTVKRNDRTCYLLQFSYQPEL